MSCSATLAGSRGCGGLKKIFRINSRKFSPAANRRGRVQNGPSDLVPLASRSHLRLRRGGRSEKACLHRCAARTSQQRCKATVSPDCDLPYESGANNGSRGALYSEVKGAPKLTESRRGNAASWHLTESTGRTHWLTRATHAAPAGAKRPRGESRPFWGTKNPRRAEARGESAGRPGYRDGTKSENACIKS